MTFTRINGSLFQDNPQQRLGDRFDPSKNYPHYSGVISMKLEETMGLVDYLSTATPNDKGEVNIRLAGWNRTAQGSGQWFLSLALSPDRQNASQQAPAGLPPGVAPAGYAQPPAPAPAGYAQPPAPAPAGYAQPPAPAPAGYAQPPAPAQAWQTAQPWPQNDPNSEDSIPF